MSRFQFVAEHQHAVEVKWMCKRVEVERSSCYEWKPAAPAPSPWGNQCARRLRPAPGAAGQIVESCARLPHAPAIAGRALAAER